MLFHPHSQNAPHRDRVSAPLCSTDFSLPGLRAALASAPSTVFVIMTSSAEGGEHWCPPCAAMQPVVEDVFGASDATGIVVRLQQDE